MEGMVSIDLWPHPDLFGSDRFLLLSKKAYVLGKCIILLIQIIFIFGRI